MLIERSDRSWIKHGYICMKMKHKDGSVEIRYVQNVIVDDASLLMAQLMSGLPAVAPGLTVLAMGTGDPGWDLQNPPIATAAQHLLVNEIERKTFDSVTYIDGLGNPTVTRTNIVDFETQFLETEAVGALVEMGLFGGTGSTGAGGGTMVNYHTFPVWNKSSTSTLTITWRLTF
jgi:hypothetical protein